MEKVIKGGSLENTVDEIAKEIIKRDKTVSDESIAAVGALQEEVSSVKSAINDITGNVLYSEFVNNRWYHEVNSVIENPDAPSSHVGAKCIKIACAAGDVFNITGTGGTTAYRLYSFTDNSYNVLSEKASTREVATNKLITAPENAAFLFCNFMIDAGQPSMLIGNTLLKKEVDTFKTNAQNNTAAIAEHETLLDELTADVEFLFRGTPDDVDSIDKAGMYQWTSNNIPANLPWLETIGGVLIQYLATGARITQYAYPVHSGLKSFFWRCKSSSGWLPWREVVSSEVTDTLDDKIDEQGTFLRNMVALITGNEFLDNWNVGYWYNTSGNVPIAVESPNVHEGSACQYVSCVEGDKFTITGIGGTSNYALYAFIDENGNPISGGKASSREVATNKVITAPEDAVYLVVNVQVISDVHALYKGEYVDRRLSELERRLNPSAIPSYYFENDYLTDKIDGIIRRSLDISGDSFIFVTDYHAHKNSGHTPSIADYIYENTGISKMLFGGDIGTSTGLNGIKTNSLAFKTLQKCIPNFYACVGNHEWKVSDSSTSAGTYNNVYNYYINQMDAKVSKMSDFGDYWIESNGQRIRYFFINQNANAKITSISLKWFMQELLNVPAGYGIVVIMHNAYHNKTYNNLASRKYLGYLNWTENNVGLTNVNVRRISQIMYAVKTRTAVKYALRPYDGTTARESDITPKDTNDSCGNYNPILSTFPDGTNTGTYTDIVSFDGSAMNTGVYPIAIFCGHKHEDAACDPVSASSFADMTDENTVYLMNDTWYRYNSESAEWVAMLAAPGASDLSQTETLPPILVIMSTTDCYALTHDEELDPTVREVGTVTEQAFDIVQIDTAGRKVYCTRIGAGNDRVFSF